MAVSCTQYCFWPPCADWCVAAALCADRPADRRTRCATFGYDEDCMALAEGLKLNRTRTSMNLSGLHGCLHAYAQLLVNCCYASLALFVALNLQHVDLTACLQALSERATTAARRWMKFSGPAKL
eukprot:5553564-Pleurochrysis_carterae.AAC.2